VPADALEPDEVLALRYDQQTVADELAAWCGGQVELAVTEDGVVTATVWVPTLKGPRPAMLGDWVVRRGPDDHAVLDDAAFAAMHGPAGS
jgi:hypothetical protein